MRLVELGEGWVGPWAGLLLADLGIEVIKVELAAIIDKLITYVVLPKIKSQITEEILPRVLDKIRKEKF